MLESEIINDYTYFTIVEKEFIKYKSLLQNILHPAGKQYVSIYDLKSTTSISYSPSSKINKEVQLKDLYYPSYGYLSSSNTFQLIDFIPEEWEDIRLSQIIKSNNWLHLESRNGEIFYSEIESVEPENDVIYLKDHNILDLPNVASGYTDSNSIQVISFTGHYDLINDGVYSNTLNKLYDIVYPGDHVLITNNEIDLVLDVDYDNMIIYTANVLNYSGNTYYPSTIDITRTFICDNVGFNYNFDYKYLLGSGNTINDINVDNFEIKDENDNLIYVPLVL